MRSSSALKIAVAGILAVFFASFILRAALRLAAAAMHSMFIFAILVIVAVWAAVKLRRA